MAKKTKSSTKLPKRIAGVRIPKAVRKSGGKLAELTAGSPIAREMLAAGLVAAAAGLVTNKRVQKAAGDVGESARDMASTTADSASRIGHAIAAAITSAAHRFYPEQDERAAPVAKAKPPRKAKRKVAARPAA